MKFIGNFCLYFAVFATFWVVTPSFMDKVSIYSWLAVMELSAIATLISNKYGGKHDE